MNCRIAHDVMEEKGESKGMELDRKILIENDQYMNETGKLFVFYILRESHSPADPVFVSICMHSAFRR